MLEPLRAALRKTVGGLKNHQAIRLPGSQGKAGHVTEICQVVYRRDQGAARQALICDTLKVSEEAITGKEMGSSLKQMHGSKAAEPEGVQ